MDYLALFRAVRERPRSHLLGDSFTEVSAFVYGCDAGSDMCLLLGFREWLIVRVAWGSNMSWPRLVLRAAFPDSDDPLATLSASTELNQRAIDVLFDLLDEFIRLRAKDGLEPIFQSYSDWSRKMEEDWDRESPVDELEDTAGSSVVEPESSTD